MTHKITSFPSPSGAFFFTIRIEKYIIILFQIKTFIKFTPKRLTPLGRFFVCINRLEFRSVTIFRDLTNIWYYAVCEFAPLIFDGRLIMVFNKKAVLSIKSIKFQVQNNKNGFLSVYKYGIMYLVDEVSVRSPLEKS